MIAEWFTEPEGFIAETAWGRFQDTPIFRSLAREHNKNVRYYPAEKVYAGEWVIAMRGAEDVESN